MVYENPILPGCHPDPSVCRAPDGFYLATSTFEYAPGVSLFHSRTLVDWTPIGHALTRASQLPIHDVASSEGVFAPTLRYRDGVFYLVTTLVGAGGNLVVTTEDPRGPWSEPTWIDAPGYDPDLFWDDGTTYLTYANDDAIHQTTVDLATGETGLVGGDADGGDGAWTIWHGLEGAYTEAPHLYAVDGTYYLLAAEGGTHTGHMVSVARSDAPTGPFESHPDNPIFSHRSRVLHPIGATGHGDLVRDGAGDWWMTFLGIRQRGEHVPYHTLGRETFLAPVSWVDGWPVVNGGDPVALVVDADPAPIGDADAEATASGEAPPGDASTDDVSTGDAPADWTLTVGPFTDGELGPAWQHRRVPHDERYDLADDALVLEGGPETLSDDRPTFVGRRQQHHACRARCTLSFDPGADEAAGLTAITNEAHHYDVAVVERVGERRAVARRRVGDLADVAGERVLPDGPVELAIESDGETYRLLAGPTDGDLDLLGTGDARMLSSEVATGFTGVYLGCFATGDGAPARTAARFTDFTYGPIEANNPV